MAFKAGTARASLTPFWGVEMAGWGYYLSRTWKQVRDPIAATALVLQRQSQVIGLVAADLMYADADFTATVRKMVAKHAPIAPEHICIGCSHSHNTPTVAFIRGAGEIHSEYKQWAAQQCATALIEAWHNLQPAQFYAGHANIEGWTANRAHPDGPVDTCMSVWKVADLQQRPIAAVVGFQSHPTAMMTLGADHVSRDFPGQIVDHLEQQYPGLRALYFQGACGDVNFLQEYNSPERCRLPGEHLSGVAQQVMESAQQIEHPILGAITSQVSLPTRRWTVEEVATDRNEAVHRIQTGDVTGWRENLGRVMVNKPDQFPQRYDGDLSRAVQALARFGMEWTTDILQDLSTREESLTTEVQALRVGDAWVVTSPAELFSSLALEVRQQWSAEHLMIIGYANDSIGYLPDAKDIEKASYAATQSPKFKNQFPFTAESGKTKVQAMLDVLEKVRNQEP